MLGVQLADYTVVSVGTLAVMGGLLHLVQREGDWAGCTKCNSQPINGWCTKFILFDVALLATDQGMPAWNDLPPTLRSSSTILGQFQSRLKTTLFRLA